MNKSMLIGAVAGATVVMAAAGTVTATEQRYDPAE